MAFFDISGTQLIRVQIEQFSTDIQWRSSEVSSLVGVVSRRVPRKGSGLTKSSLYHGLQFHLFPTRKFILWKRDGEWSGRDPRSKDRHYLSVIVDGVPVPGGVLNVMGHILLLHPETDPVPSVREFSVV